MGNSESASKTAPIVSISKDVAEDDFLTAVSEADFQKAVDFLKAATDGQLDIMNQAIDQGMGIKCADPVSTVVSCTLVFLRLPPHQQTSPTHVLSYVSSLSYLYTCPFGASLYFGTFRMVAGPLS